MGQQYREDDGQSQHGLEEGEYKALSLVQSFD